jgi:hypothetical protein
MPRSPKLSILFWYSGQYIATVLSDAAFGFIDHFNTKLVITLNYKAIINFGETYDFHLQDRRVCEARNQLSLVPPSAGFFLGLLIDPTCSSETSDSLLTTWLYNSEGPVLQKETSCKLF